MGTRSRAKKVPSLKPREYFSPRDHAGFNMKRVFKKSNDFNEAEKWDIQQNLRLTPEQRQKAAAELRKRVYGKKIPAIREARDKQ
jgi:hypothetical protein